MNQSNDNKKECLPKLPTGISGLDKILYGGIDVNYSNNNKEPLIIVIRGNEYDNDKNMLAMQMLYGIAQSIEREKKQYESFSDWNNTPVMYSTCHNEAKLNDLFLDFFISSSLQQIIKKKASRDTSVSLNSNIFASLLFNCLKIECSGISSHKNIPYTAITNNVDAMIGDGIIYYNRRTNSLHMKVDLYSDDNKYNQIYRRSEDSICKYNDRYYKKPENGIFYKYTGLFFLAFNMICKHSLKSLEAKIADDKHLIGVDVSNCKNLTLADLNGLFDKLEDAKIAIIVVDSDAVVPENRANMIINLSQETDHKFVLKHIHITKSDSQDFFPGNHQYKKRDFGIEVYPRKELYISERRYLQRALVYTHSDAVTETYQQYLQLQKYYQDTPTYENYEDDLKKNKPFFSLFPKDYMEVMSIDLLNRIFIPINPLRHLHRKSNEEEDFIENEYMYGNAGFVTAVVGKANTYKRFLTFGGIFGSACAKDHTLIVMMNKEESVIRRRLICPAKPWKIKQKMTEYCRNCYRYIHFMNICMGNITPEEFLYYLEKQIEVPYDNDTKKRVRRIVIDDLQILDFCFPRLKNDGLFLAALTELCRVHDIILYVLCDTSSEMYPTLRALADNVVFTRKDNDGHPLIFVEKFAGYTNTPSKMYCGKVNNVNKLFKCVENFTNLNSNKFEFQSNIVEFEDVDESIFEN